MEIIDGKKISSEIKEEMAREVEQIRQSGRKIPHLAAVLVGHDGPHHIAVAEGRPVLRGLALYHGKRGYGVSVEFSLKHGPISCVGLTQTFDGKFKFVVAEGESLPGAIPPTGNTNTRGRFPPDVSRFIENWSLEGPTHHFALAIGHIAHLIEDFSRCWGIECVNVTAPDYRRRQFIR